MEDNKMSEDDFSEYGFEDDDDDSESDDFE